MADAAGNFGGGYRQTSIWYRAVCHAGWEEAVRRAEAAARAVRREEAPAAASDLGDAPGYVYGIRKRPGRRV